MADRIIKLSAISLIIVFLTMLTLGAIAAGIIGYLNCPIQQYRIAEALSEMIFTVLMGAFCGALLAFVAYVGLTCEFKSLAKQTFFRSSVLLASMTCMILSLLAGCNAATAYSVTWQEFTGAFMWGMLNVLPLSMLVEVFILAIVQTILRLVSCMARPAAVAVVQVVENRQEVRHVAKNRKEVQKHKPWISKVK